MNETAYYQVLSLTQPVRTRIESILAQIRAMCPEELKDIFVSDLVQQDGTRPPTELSRLTIKVSFTEGIRAHLQAAGLNCEMLRHVCVQYLSTGLLGLAVS